ncbi:MAG: L,D-transpeptidase family protein [Chloroflexota bacterium]
MSRGGVARSVRAAAGLAALTALVSLLAALCGAVDRPAPAAAGWGGWIAAEQANVRSGPGVWSEVTGHAWLGEWVDISAGPSDGGWYEVAAPAAFGWIDGGLLAFDAPPGASAAGERWLDVDRGDGVVTLYDGETPVRTWWGVMSADPSDDGFYATALGTFHIYEMNESLAWTDWGQAWISHWVGFDADRMNGFHSFLLDESGGVVEGGDSPTGGCVALPPAAAAELFWSVSPGMRVEVHW